MKLATHKKYQNYLFALLVVSGSLKVVLSYYNFPYDITLFILFLIVVDIFYISFIKRRIVFKKVEVIYIFIILIFYLIAGLSILYTPSTLGYEKFFLMLIPLTGFLYTKFIKELNLKILFRILLYIMLPLSFWFILFKFLLWNDISFIEFRTDTLRFNPLRNTYLNFGYLMGLMCILSLKFFKKPMLIFILGIIAMLGLGSRGALLFLFFSIAIVYFKQIVFFFNNLKLKKSFFNFLFLSFIPIPIFIVVFFDKIEKLIGFGFSRFISLLNASSDESVLGRLNHYFYVIDEGLTIHGLTIGNGLASFGISYLKEDILAYPHNIFLEAWYELGFIAMCLLALFFILPFFHLKRKQILFAIALFAFLNAMKTLSFSTDRNLFILFGVLLFHKELKDKLYN
ncbi:hypothetical protein [Snuella sedimenti]|uniref:O-antigen ligase-like membrane protein n=1 Tax=Snuella sedimenti TaxID=2798802 RepID=A0A8J7INW0_9FLAO|nr:hypothetical protein [Snuella sedimenti]MBJ6368157.1 hypothetical protein [Snuella sedimenti]